MSSIRSRRGVLITGTVLFSVGLAGSAQAGMGPFLWINDANAGLGVVDTHSGAVSLVGNTSVIMSDIAFDAGGNLWGITFSTLYRINRTTAAITFVGNHGQSAMNALVFGPNGTLYAADFGGGRLYSLSTTTGQATVLGNLGYDSAGDLAFHQGSFYMSDAQGRLIRISLSPSVSATVVGSFGFSNVYGLATGDDGVLYGAAGTQIFSVNTTTGVGTLVSNYDGHGLTNANGTSFVNEVPAPSGLAVVGAGLLAAARRRRA